MNRNPPPPVIEEGKRLYFELSAKNDGAEGIDILFRLLSEPMMKNVWAEIYKKKRSNYAQTDEFLHPACVTNASIAKRLREQAVELSRSVDTSRQLQPAQLEREADWTESQPDIPFDTSLSEQDRGAQLFLRHALLSGMNTAPVFSNNLATEQKKLAEIASAVRAQAEALKLLKMNSLAERLIQLAGECDDELAIRLVDHKTNDPWVIARDRGDANERTYAVDLSIATKSVFGKVLHQTIANVTNVVFERQDITKSKIVDWLRP